MTESPYHITTLIEILAKGEHEQWSDWAKAILKSEPGLSQGRKDRWPEMITTPYELLSEELKRKDRVEVYIRSKAALDWIKRLTDENNNLKELLRYNKETLDAYRLNNAAYLKENEALKAKIKIALDKLKRLL